MKAKAPEKLYIHQDDGLIYSCRYNKDDIKYTRTDVFIEKAVQYLKDHKEEVETEDNGIAGWIPDYFIKDFEKYMKGD